MPSVPILLDLSAAIDNIDYNILLNRHWVGISDTALKWFLVCEMVCLRGQF